MANRHAVVCWFLVISCRHVTPLHPAPAARCPRPHRSLPHKFLQSPCVKHSVALKPCAFSLCGFHKHQVRRSCFVAIEEDLPALSNQPGRAA